MEKIIYEYKIICYRTDNFVELEKSLQEMSEDGWELISVVEDRHYFKRPKISSEYHVNPKTGNYEIK